jgi:hypothetical protein
MLKTKCKVTGYTLAVGRNALGAFVGYVQVPKQHAWFNLNYTAIEDELYVHGGITYSGPLDELGTWWFGFDCAHAFDHVPGILALLKQTGFEGELWEDGKVWDADAVLDECRNLAVQLLLKEEGDVTNQEEAPLDTDARE